MHSVSRGAFFVAALLGLVACPQKNDDDTPKPLPTPSAPAAASTPTEVKVEAPAKLAITPRVKAELDGRADGLTGTALAVTGAAASMQTPAGWTVTKAEFSTAASADKKAQLAAGTVGPEGPTGKLPAAAAALGLTACEWGTPESLTVGKGKLPATAADGVCTRGQTQVRTAYVAPLAEKLLVVGTWDQDGDSASLFGAMRSIAKAGVGDSSGIAACCAALRQNAKIAPPEQQGGLLLAAGACDAARNNPDARAALATVRAALAGANAPASCK
jgi:hypothetical protein